MEQKNVLPELDDIIMQKFASIPEMRTGVDKKLMGKKVTIPLRIKNSRGVPFQSITVTEKIKPDGKIKYMCDFSVRKFKPSCGKQWCTMRKCACNKTILSKEHVSDWRCPTVKQAIYYAWNEYNTIFECEKCHVRVYEGSSNHETCFSCLFQTYIGTQEPKESVINIEPISILP